jgi:YD repeat-containing protein
MSERARWDLRGPAHICRRQRTMYLRQCGAEACDTEERTDVDVVEFLEDGSLARLWHKNPDGSEWTSTYEYNDADRLTAIQNGNGDRHCYHYDSEGRLAGVTSGDRLSESYEYDPAGRKKKTLHIDVASQNQNTHYAWGVEGSDSAYSAPGAAALATLYNEREQPAELHFYDSSGRLLSRVDFIYDQNGNLVEEERTNSAETLSPERFPDMNAPQLQTLRLLLGAAGEPIRRTHRYNEQDRRIESRSGIGRLGATTQTIGYNDHGDRVEEVFENEEREYSVDDEGRLSEPPVTKRVSRSEARLRYDYDSHGNWVTKTVENQSGTNHDFTVSSIERRTISYY